MSEILIIGNGFDLAHKLPTSYNDYLFLVKNIRLFEKEKVFRDSGECSNDVFDKYFQVELSNTKELEAFITLAKTNPWIQYFANCEAEIKGWIDFENEMLPICEAFDTLFKSKFKAYSPAEINGESIYNVPITSWYDMLNLLLWNNIFLDSRSGNNIYIKEKYANPRQGILRDRVIKELRDSFMGFKQSMILYMKLFVEGIDIHLSAQIHALNPSAILSFNYTDTENKYFTLKSSRVCHVHGTIANNEIVLGTDLLNDDSKYIFLTKNFQRLTHVNDFGYKRFLPGVGSDVNVDIIGHSLDENDRHIFEQFIINANKTYIYYYNNDDYESKMANLLKLFGGEIIERWVYNKKIEFKELLEF